MLDVRPDKQWLTAAEAEAEGLPSFAFTKQYILRWVFDNNVATRSRARTGGRPGREFHWTDLPREARDAYLKRYGVAAANPQQQIARAANKDLLAEARARIVDAAKTFAASHPHKRALRDFSDAYNRGRSFGFDPFVRELVPAIAEHQLRCWRRTIKAKGAGALIDGRGRPEGSGMIERNAELCVFITARVAENAHLSACHILRDIQEAGLPNVAKRTLQDFLKRLRANNKALLTALEDPDRAKSHYQPAFGSRSAGILRINQRWEMDGTRADAMCRMPDGSHRRVTITALIDVMTRRALVLVSDQGRAAATMALLRRAILAWGMPEQLKTDNGKEFTAQAVVSFCRDLGIELIYSQPFRPEQKPHIERFFGTFNRGLFPRLPEFVGHSVADRKAIEGRRSFQHRFGEDAQISKAIALTPGELQARCDHWLAEEYEQAAHEGLKVGATPAEAALILAPQVRQIADERALDQLLLIEQGGRQVVKKGIRIANRWYIAGALGAYMGERVSIRIDPHDPSVIFVYSADRKTFLCVAECPDFIAPQRQMEIAVMARREHADRIRRVRADARKVLARHAGKLDGNNVIPLTALAAESMRLAAPPPLAAQRDALDAADAHAQGPQPVDATADQVATADAMVADMEARSARPAAIVECDGYTRPQFETDLGLWRWAERHIAAGGTLDTHDASAIAQLRANRTFQLQVAASAAFNA
jgi:putative transposase